MRVEIYAKREADGLWTGHCTSVRPGYAGLTVTAATKEDALRLAREDAIREAVGEVNIVEVPVPLSRPAEQMLQGLVRGLVTKFKNDGGRPGEPIPPYVIKVPPNEAEAALHQELLAGEYIDRVDGGIRLTQAGLRAQSGVQSGDGVYSYFP